jgi:hypothetical protein
MAGDLHWVDVPGLANRWVPGRIPPVKRTQPQAIRQQIHPVSDSLTPRPAGRHRHTPPPAGTPPQT